MQREREKKYIVMFFPVKCPLPQVQTEQAQKNWTMKCCRRVTECDCDSKATQKVGKKCL